MMYCINVHYLVLLSLCLYGTGSYGQESCSSCQCPYVPGEKLDCSGRGITNITECEPLDGCLNVIYLNFSNNAITEITNLDIDDPTDISTVEGDCYLDFSSNLISKFVLPQGNYQERYYMCQSITVDLSSNVLWNISENSLRLYITISSQFESLTLNISRNRVKFIESIFLRNGGYRIIENVTVDLSFNEINHAVFRIGEYNYIRRLDILLNGNNITHFGISDFLRNQRRRGLSFMFIDLSNNYMSRFTEDDLTTDRFYVDVRLDLSGNRWNCNCSQRPISDGNSSLRSVLIKKRSVQPICADPPSVRGRPILSLSAEEFVCSPEVGPNAPLQREAFLGDTVEMLCPFVGGDPPVDRVDWEFTPGHSRESVDGASFQFQSCCVNCPLLINNVQKGAEGEYRCTVSNGETLTIRQTLRVMGDDDTEMTPPPMSPNGEGTIGCPTAGQTGLVVVVIVMGILWIITTISLIVVGYKFYQLKRDGGTANTDVAVKYQAKPRGMPQSQGKDPGQGNGGYDEEHDTYEVPRDIADGRPPQQLHGVDRAIYEVKNPYINVRT